MFDEIFSVTVADAAFGWRSPVALGAGAISGNRHRVGRGEPANVSKGGGGLVAVQTEQQKVAYGGIIQVRRNVRMLPQAIQNVAEQKELAKFGVVKGLDAEMVAGAKKFPLARVPDRERKIPAQALYAILPPNRIRPQNQIGVARRAAL